MLHTVVSRDEALSSKLLHGGFGTMGEKQHIPVTVPHVEKTLFQL